jgi:predicted GNAT family acetyltransferase
MDDTADAAATIDKVVTDVDGRSRYEITADGELAGFAEYRDIDGARVFTHTEVFDQYEGKGIGSALVRAALDSVRAGAGGGRLVPLCPFVRSYIEGHAEAYGDLVDTELTERLQSGRR